MKKINLKIKGMHCQSCAMLIADALEDLGVSKSNIDSKTGTAIIEFDEKKITEEKIKEAIEKENYRVK